LSSDDNLRAIRSSKDGFDSFSGILFLVAPAVAVEALVVEAAVVAVARDQQEVQLAMMYRPRLVI